MEKTTKTAETSMFPKLDRVARSQRRLKMMNSLASIVFAGAAVLISLGSLAACGEPADASDDAAAIVEELNVTDGHGSAATYSDEDLARLGELRADLGRATVRYELRRVFRDRALVAVMPEGAAEAPYTIDLAIRHEDLRVVRISIAAE